MEYVNGRTLKEVLAAEGRLQPRRALEISADICAALEFSHRHGIIHRDIKPGNVMLTPNGQVKVMDFGIARALASGATTMTQTSAVIGTAQYLSPEQARGEAVDARSDVYAAGCVLFELLCGHPPFVGDSPVAWPTSTCGRIRRRRATSNREVTPDIDAIVFKALAKNPLNRYQSAAEMRADLLRAAAGRPVLATPVMREDGDIARAAAAVGSHGARRSPAGPGRRRTQAPGARPGSWPHWSTLGRARGGGSRRRARSCQPAARTSHVPNVVGMTRPRRSPRYREELEAPSWRERTYGACELDKVVEQSPKRRADKLPRARRSPSAFAVACRRPRCRRCSAPTGSAPKSCWSGAKLVADVRRCGRRADRQGHRLSFRCPRRVPRSPRVHRSRSASPRATEAGAKRRSARPRPVAKAELEAHGFLVSVKPARDLDAAAGRQGDTTGSGAQ